MNIQINRATKEGVKKCDGELFEFNGYQFCLDYVEDHWSAIELSTGMRAVGILDEFLCLGNSEAFDRVKQQIKSISLEKMTQGIENAKTILEVYHIEYPLNKPIEKI